MNGLLNYPVSENYGETKNKVIYMYLQEKKANTHKSIVSPNSSMTYGNVPPGVCLQDTSQQLVYPHPNHLTELQPWLLGYDDITQRTEHPDQSHFPSHLGPP